MQQDLDKENRQQVLEFFQGVYPFDQIDSKVILAEVWPRLTAKTFYEGDVLKPYDHHPLDIYIIFDGEAAVVTRT